MTQQNIEMKISKESAHMTERGQKPKVALPLRLKLLGHGGRRIKEERKHTMQLPEKSRKAHYFASHAKFARIQNQSPTTMTTINLLMSGGYVMPVIANII